MIQCMTEGIDIHAPLVRGGTEDAARAAVLSFLLCVTLLVFLSGCGEKVTPENEADTPANHYAAGMHKLDDGDAEGAEKEFRRALALDDDAPCGHTGLAFLALAGKDYGEALKCARKALKCDGDFPDAHIALGYTLTVRKHGDWFAGAEAALLEALELDPGNQRGLFCTGECYLKEGRYDDALGYYGQAADLDGPFTRRAESRLELVSKVRDDPPRPGVSWTLILEETLDRAGLCVLLAEEFDILAVLEAWAGGGDAVDQPSDTGRNRWRRWIGEVLPLGLQGLSVLPDGRFYPGRALTRAQCAEICQDIIIRYTGESSLSSRYSDGPSPFHDLRDDFYAYNAIRLCVELAVLEPREDGRFDARGTVSGLDALEMLRNLDRALDAHR